MGYTVIDVETTGLSPERHDRILEIGVVYVSDAGQVQDRWATLVNPGRDVGPTRIHGISASDVLGAPTFEELAPYVLRAVAGRTIVAHNAPFDLRFLSHELDRAGMSLGRQRPSGLCTMQWSTAYLEAPSRRLVDCCAASGVGLQDAHSALADATATAGLLTYYLGRSGGRPPWDEVLQHTRSYPWPSFTGPYPTVGMVGRRPTTSPAADPWLGGIISRMPRSADAGTDSYLALLEAALLDDILDDDEKEALVAAAQDSGLTRAQVLQVHRGYLDDMARVAVRDHRVTDEEHTKLVHTTRLLGLSSPDVDTALDQAWQELRTGSTEPVRETTAGIMLEPGDRVAFTGETQVDRPVWEARAQASGLTTGAVTKKAKVLVASDPNTLSSKANKARAYDVPIVSESAFEHLMSTFESAATAPVT